MKKLKGICLLALCTLSLGKTYAQTEAAFYTTMGNFKVVLTDSLTPRTVDSFIARITDKFYDGLLFHRVIDGFVIQGGDPLGNGMGGPGYTIPDEIVPSLKHLPGALGMANAGPNTNGSQFFVDLVHNTSLDNKYTVFGMVTEGFSVVQAIAKVPKDGNDKPLTDVKMDSIRITKFPVSVSAINGKDIRIYPNPGNGMFNIELPSIKTKVEVVNRAGQVVFQDKAKNKLKINLQGQPAGLYIVHLSNSDGTANSKIIIQ